GVKVNKFNKFLKVIILVIVISGIATLGIYVLDIHSGAKLSQEKQNSQLLEHTCDEVKYDAINCEIYKELAKELDNFDLPEISQNDIYCLSTAALSVELPPLTPPDLVNVVVSKTMDSKGIDCNVDAALQRIKDNMNEYQKYKKAEKEANKY
ncbi:hypothetical protein ACAS46_004382, partial [Vibrio vulnificus]